MTEIVRLPSEMSEQQAKSGLRGDTLAESKAALKAGNQNKSKACSIYSKIDNATLCPLAWTQAVNFISKGTIFRSYVPATA